MLDFSPRAPLQMVADHADVRAVDERRRVHVGPRHLVEVDERALAELALELNLTAEKLPDRGVVNGNDRVYDRKPLVGSGAMGEIKAVVIRGDLSTDEFALLVACIRLIDEKRPGAKLEIIAVDPTSTALETAERILHEAVPPREGRATVFTSIKT